MLWIIVIRAVVPFNGEGGALFRHYLESKLLKNKKITAKTEK